MSETLRAKENFRFSTGRVKGRVLLLLLRPIQRHMEESEHIRCRELAKSSSSHYKLYSEIEEVGWEHLVRLNDDLAYLSLRISDKTGKAHIVEIQFSKTNRKCPPSVSADVPYLPNIEWSKTSRLKDLVLQLQKHLDMLQEFWSTLHDIDKSLWVVGPKLTSRASCTRQVNLGNDCVLLLSLNAHDPRSLPECRFLGPDSAISSLRITWIRNCKNWAKEKSFADNLASILGFELPKPEDTQKNQELECGICYAQCLPIDDELGTKSGSGTDYTCNNSNCNRSFHSICLADWLRSITTTRQSFDLLFGNCPYCSEAVAVKAQQHQEVNPKKPSILNHR